MFYSFENVKYCQFNALLFQMLNLTAETCFTHCKINCSYSIAGHIVTVWGKLSHREPAIKPY